MHKIYELSRSRENSARVIVATTLLVVLGLFHASVIAQQNLQEWQKKELFNDAILQTRVCMRDGVRAMLLTGQRQAPAIVDWVQQTCSPQLLSVMEMIGRPKKEATAFAKALAMQEALQYPELRAQISK